MSERRMVMETNRCSATADDGQQCVRPDHVLSEPDAHDFVPRSENPVDGGQKWSRWIQAVYAARSAILVDVEDDGRTRFWEYGVHANLDDVVETLGLIAEAIGLRVIRDGNNAVVRIEEGEPSPDATWQRS